MFEYFEDTDTNSTDDDNLILADRLGSKCVQVGMFNHDFDGSEDCLFLNVYSPIVS